MGINLFFIVFPILINECVGNFIVHTRNGALQGTEFTIPHGRKIHAFLGIPFAKPPLGKLRFREPQPVENWKGVKSAQNFSSKCSQFNLHRFLPLPVTDHEDCLYLNVFTPIVSNRSKLDVIFYIHGGAFMFGSGIGFTPYYILNNHDIVYVSINYRLGPFGFLSTEDEVIPGNNGLKDQVLALKWVQDNIEQFGGDRNKITIAGLSAGGASVHLHYLSPLSKDLFSQGISTSGSAFCPWVIAENPRSKAERLAASVGCPTSNSHQLLDCLQLKKPEEILSNIEDLFMPWGFNPFSPFGPVIEPDIEGAFLSKDPYQLVSEGNIQDLPWMASVTSEEGLYPAAYFINDDKLLNELEQNWNQIAPHLLDYNHTIPQEQIKEVSDEIRKFYLGDDKITRKKRTNLVKLISDRLFITYVEHAARLQASVNSAPVYFYVFSYRGIFSLSEILCKCNENFGTSHGDDMLYLFKTPLPISIMESEEEKKMVDTMVNVWTSFVQEGTPSASPETVWVPIPPHAADEGNISYVNISSSKNIKTESSKDLGNRKFWNSLPLQELWNAPSRTNQKYIDEL